MLQEDVSSLVHALIYDEQGQPKIKIELARDIEVLLSAFLRKVRSAPVGSRSCCADRFACTNSFELSYQSSPYIM